ncbi:F-box/LRR protein [Medicago truncatula]|uniref:F-box/LRR protein n=2 Tax=Medicago truncatula TaxID=3880 RepID=G7J789_MEDTR|nr:F-box/LRR protein [Medicago truncatula]
MEEESESTTGPPAMEEESESTRPNWLDLPSDLTENILQRLGIEIVTSACCVCTQWLKICKDPLMWRTIRMCYICDLSYLRFRRIFYKVVNRSCGHLKDINIEYYCTDDILKCIADNGRHLCRMGLVDCSRITDEGFSEAVRKLPRLEKVVISHHYLTDVSLEALGRSCPLLKSLKFVNSRFTSCDSDKTALVIAETMPGLRHLDMKGHKLTELGVLAIIDKCPLLESLDIRDCHYLNEGLEKSCIDQINDLHMPVRYNHENNYYNDRASFWGNIISVLMMMMMMIFIIVWKFK